MPVFATPVEVKGVVIEHESCDSEDTCSVSDFNEIEGATDDLQD